MKEEDKLVERFGRKGPWTVPEGYFESVRIEISSKLPEYPEKPKPIKLSKWQRVKPYVYLAAMFAGIWCMMQMFHHVSSNVGGVNLDNPPEQLALLMSDPEMTDVYLTFDHESDEQLIDEVSGMYDNFQDFEEDFGQALEPAYENINV